MVIEIIGELSERSIATARIETVAGAVVVMAEVSLAGASLKLRALHIEGLNVRVNELRVAGLRRIVREVTEDLDVDEIVIEGSIRTSGAGPGRSPRVLRFTRQVSAAK